MIERSSSWISRMGIIYGQKQSKKKWTPSIKQECSYITLQAIKSMTSINMPSSELYLIWNKKIWKGKPEWLLEVMWLIPLCINLSHHLYTQVIRTIAMNEGFNMIVGDIGNTFVKAYKTWKEKGLKNCVLELSRYGCFLLGIIFFEKL